jgi:hypothetical protein
MNGKTRRNKNYFSGSFVGPDVLFLQFFDIIFALFSELALGDLFY